ncbi:2-amino-4-hydroxy-6-hydroxymethyldihydropteridine diphosphokinase [Loktanella sp. S4079]|uniref:2-amino-4-hydroxy-6- hydroxymethyldihydropteridine diphosphokinase n=1 Tax=Loktanella sp. S4079 TaxID=579483 RepID=UPI001EF724FA|nr:2-amino-4-hydroxy-6-hydroxymethyldihydropteridine diphosphokinase [Loktanella sp. S4079]
MALIAFGSNENSNLGDPRETIQKAMKNIADMSVSVKKVSQSFTTPAFPVGAGPDYVNAAMAVKTNLSATKLLSKFHEIEALAMRKRDQRWGQRTLDIDLIALDSQVLPDLSTYQEWRNLDVQTQQERAPRELILPHPRVQDRAFVLVPLCEVAPDWTHPVLGRTVREMRDALPASDLAAVVPIPD